MSHTQIKLLADHFLASYSARPARLVFMGVETPKPVLQPDAVDALTDNKESISKDTQERLAATKKDVENYQGLVTTIKYDFGKFQEKFDSVDVALVAARGDEKKLAVIAKTQFPALAQFSVLEGTNSAEEQKIYRTEMMSRINSYLKEKNVDNALASQILLKCLEAGAYTTQPSVDVSIRDASRMMQHTDKQTSTDLGNLFEKDQRSDLTDKMGEGVSLSLNGTESVTLGDKQYAITGVEILTGAAMTEIDPRFTAGFDLQNAVLQEKGDNKYILARMENGCKGNFVVLRVQDVDTEQEAELKVAEEVAPEPDAPEEAPDDKPRTCDIAAAIDQFADQYEKDEPVNVEFDDTIDKQVKTVGDKTTTIKKQIKRYLLTTRSELDKVKSPADLNALLGGKKITDLPTEPNPVPHARDVFKDQDACVHVAAIQLFENVHSRTEDAADEQKSGWDRVVAGFATLLEAPNLIKRALTPEYGKDNVYHPDIIRLGSRWGRDGEKTFEQKTVYSEKMDAEQMHYEFDATQSGAAVLEAMQSENPKLNQQVGSELKAEWILKDIFDEKLAERLLVDLNSAGQLKSDGTFKYDTATLRDVLESARNAHKVNAAPQIRNGVLYVPQQDGYKSIGGFGIEKLDKSVSWANAVRALASAASLVNPGGVVISGTTLALKGGVFFKNQEGVSEADIRKDFEKYKAELEKAAGGLPEEAITTLGALYETGEFKAINGAIVYVPVQTLERAVPIVGEAPAKSVSAETDWIPTDNPTVPTSAD